MNQPRQKKHKKLVTAILLAGLLLIEGLMYYNHYSYGYHLEKASGSLQQLEAMLEKAPSEGMLSASILNASPEESQELDENKLSRMANKAVKSTERALKNVDDLEDIDKLKSAIDEILTFQDHQIKVLESVSLTLENPEVIHEMTDTIDIAIELQEKTVQAKEKVESAIANNQETIQVVIIAEKEHQEHAEGEVRSHDNTPEKEAPNSHAATHSVDTPARATDNSHIDANQAYELEQKKKDEAQREANRQRILLIQSAQKH